MFKKLLAAAFICGAMFGCGGGGDSSPVAISDPAASAGLWKGGTSTGRNAYGVLLGDGTYWFICTAVGSSSRIAGVGEGTATSIGGTLTSVDGLDFNLEGLGVSAARITATYSPRTSLSGTVHYSSQSVPFTASYVSVPPAALSQIAGSYRGTAAVVSAAEAVNVTISASGTISGTGASGCRFTGSATPRIDVAVFDVKVTFSGGVCVLGTATVNGVAFYDTGAGQLISAALNSDRSNGFLAIGTKL